MKLPVFLSILSTLPVTADELTIEAGPLETTLELEATVYPEEPKVIRLEPKQWSKFVIESAVAHGTPVTKEDVILAFEADEYLRHLEESKEAAKGRKIALSKLERELADLETTTTHALEGLKLAHDRAKEALDYFTNSGRALQVESAKQSLDRAKRSLSYQEEELQQLLKMYEEDGITEETEEIILKRQRAAVETAKFALKKATEDTQWTLEKTIPRRAVDFRRAFEQAKLAYETGQLNLPRTLEEKKLEVAKAQRAEARAAQDLLELEGDGSLLVIKAPADGVIYHGEVTPESWSLGGTAKFLFKAGTAPVDTALMSLVPASSSFVLHGKTGQADFLELETGLKGTATIEGLSESQFPVEVTSLSAAPESDGKYGVGTTLTTPDGTPLLAGMKATVTLVTYRNEEAIAVPKTALIRKDGKTMVKLKMADGKHELRTIKTGRQSGDRVEVLSGLEIDQVILTSNDGKSD